MTGVNVKALLTILAVSFAHKVTTLAVPLTHPRDKSSAVAVSHKLATLSSTLLEHRCIPRIHNQMLIADIKEGGRTQYR